MAFRRVASSNQASSSGSDASASSSTSAISVAAASRMERHRVSSARPRPYASRLASSGISPSSSRSTGASCSRSASARRGSPPRSQPATRPPPQGVADPLRGECVAPPPPTSRVQTEGLGLSATARRLLGLLLAARVGTAPYPRRCRPSPSASPRSTSSRAVSRRRVGAQAQGEAFGCGAAHFRPYPGATNTLLMLWEALHSDLAVAEPPAAEEARAPSRAARLRSDAEVCDGGPPRGRGGLDGGDR